MKNDMPQKTDLKNALYSAHISDLPKSRIEVIGEVPWSHMESFEHDAFATLAEQVQLDGFREGKVPTDIARKHIPDERVLADMAELAINSVYPLIIRESERDVIGRPDVAITKIARGNPLCFTITAAIVPAIDLPEYKDTARTIVLDIPVDVTETDVDKVVDELRQMRAYGHVHSADAKENHSHDHDQPLPEADDAFAQSFGTFKTIVEFRAKIKENLMLEAEQATHDKRRIAIMETIIAGTTFDVPDVIIQSESDKMLTQLEADLARSSTTLDDYLTHINKTKEDLLTEFAPEAEKRARFQLVLNAIARAENLLPNEAEVEAETQKFIAMYPGADPIRTRAYADMLLTNEKVLAFLENDK